MHCVVVRADPENSSDDGNATVAGEGSTWLSPWAIVFISLGAVLVVAGVPAFYIRQQKQKEARNTLDASGGMSQDQLHAKSRKSHINVNNPLDSTQELAAVAIAVPGPTAP